MLWSSSIATTATGIVYGWMKYLMTPADPWAAVNHPLEPLVLKLHIVTAPLLVFALGMVALRHAWMHFTLRVPVGRRSGITGALVAAVMIVSGYLIQVFTGSLVLAALAAAHVAAGLVYAAALVVHRVTVGARRVAPSHGRSASNGKLSAPASGA
jgi:hypothetical protein